LSNHATHVHKITIISARQAGEGRAMDTGRNTWEQYLTHDSVTRWQVEVEGKRTKSTTERVNPLRLRRPLLPYGYSTVTGGCSYVQSSTCTVWVKNITPCCNLWFSDIFFTNGS